MTEVETEKSLIKKRAAFKGRLTSFSNYLNTLETSLDEDEVGELRQRLGKIESVYFQYDEVQLQLESICENVDIQISERNEFESLYCRLVSRAQTKVNAYERAHEKDGSSSNSHSQSKLTRKQVKLPTIRLPKFSGSYENWLEFKDTFVSLVHSDDGMEDINKFHYLRASLEGSAAVAIQSVKFSAEYYHVAWNLLIDRFDNKRLLVHNHVSALFNMQAISKESSISLKSMIDQLNKNVRVIESLGDPINQRDTLIIHIISNKLDPTTLREWERFKNSLDKNSPTSLDTFLTFLRNRADFIETLELSRNNNHTPRKVSSNINTMMSSQGINNSRPCPKCHGEHGLANCSQFLSLNNEARLKLLPTFKICFNCFRSGHYANHCKKPGCKVCKRKHNTLVHVSVLPDKQVINNELQRNQTDTALGNNSDAQGQRSTVSGSETSNNLVLTARVAAQCSHEPSAVLLSTALVKLYDNNKREHIARALLDSGSTSCLMTEKMFYRLNLSADRVNKTVLGINNVPSRINQRCHVTLKSLNENFTTNLQCFVLPSITDNIPSKEIDLFNLNIPTNICLADPNFHSPASIDLIIGADVFWDLLGTQRKKLGEGKPTLYETRLGWLVSGPINSGLLGSPIKCNFTKLDDIQSQLTRFWQLEEVSPQSSIYFPEEKLCEQHFVDNTSRLEDGRFCVRIPLKDNPDKLGDSLQRATHCLISLERRLKKQPALCKMYTDFMLDYEQLGHMTECSDTNSNHNAYFIPHHGVLRESSSTTKLRVVFNASSPTSSGVSSNNLQMVGPTVQDDILSILLRFRLHKYVLAADVEKMYRQVAVHPSDRYLQQILWRYDPSEPVKVYQLNTVTYGTASAPFLATRCLKQVGLESDDKITSDVIIHDFYVDDLLTGGNDFNEVLKIRENVSAALASAGMPLRKWKSNEPLLVAEVTDLPVNLNIGDMTANKTLGLGWQSNSDQLCFPIGNISNNNTKRDMLSVIAQIFDPLGLLAPCIVAMKMLLQKLWLEKLSWDEQLTSDVSKVWSEIVKHLPDLNLLRVPRRVVCNSYKYLDFHIFTDASERAYGACLYIRSVDDKKQVLVRLLLAKSRVAPIKPTTIPRLELCGALIGARLYERAANAFRVPIRHTTFWTDSTIVLGWLKMLPNKLQPFVRNRVAEVLEKTDNCTWRHVPTDSNPADLISRGVCVTEISSLDLWWSGPTFLGRDQSNWPLNSSANIDELPETRPSVVLHTTETEYTELIDFNRFSNLTRLIRTIAYVTNFIKNCKKEPITTGFFTASELKAALSILIILSQRETFPEYKILLNNQTLPRKSQLLKFNIFLDENKLMRVGGRLENSNFSYDKKHPILLQSTHKFTKLLFQYEHKRLMHAGPQLLLASIRETYWPIGGRNLAKATFHQCVTCRRAKGHITAPLMGNLPRQRISPGCYPFENVGVDYAGPVTAASRQGRGCRFVKLYIAIFVCFATKATHIELVGDLTSKNFISALRRFISRRGKPNNIYSDNGTSFVGAHNEISNFLKSHSNSLSDCLSNEGISFHFMPAYAPHFGGLWEAGVKSVKFHLKRVLGNCNLTYEELNTVLVQIEAILNSRPLTPLSSDPEDLMPLTPSHFIIGRPLTSLPSGNYLDRNTNYLTRYQRIEQLRQHFWSRWSTEYVSELQHRSKWRSSSRPLNTGTLVLLKEENLPPLKWRLGRIVAVHPGSDGVARVADIKTSNGIVRRAWSKICPLLESDSR